MDPSSEQEKGSIVRISKIREILVLIVYSFLRGLELLGSVQLLHIDSLHHLLAVDDAWLLKLLTCAQTFDNACTL